jgi:hypothetical protein
MPLPIFSEIHALAALQRQRRYAADRHWRRGRFDGGVNNNLSLMSGHINKSFDMVLAKTEEEWGTRASAFLKAK